ncbi:transmembrane protein 65 isoform X5 [Ailuropoda melanoleuca]|nr:transmembrane protein 65 isoform X5 [Ailuropoda melanoleuca]
MIVAGTHIEMSIGIILGISTMAAAALGNLVSDLAGLGLAGYVEALASRLGLSIPDLTPKQVDMWQTRVSTHFSYTWSCSRLRGGDPVEPEELRAGCIPTNESQRSLEAPAWVLVHQTFRA